MNKLYPDCFVGKIVLFKRSLISLLHLGGLNWPIRDIHWTSENHEKSFHKPNFWQPCSSRAHTLMHRLKMSYTVIQPSAKLEMKYSSSFSLPPHITTTWITSCTVSRQGCTFLSFCWCWHVGMADMPTGPRDTRYKFESTLSVYNKTSLNWLV